MPDLEKIEAELRAGLEGVMPGPWGFEDNVNPELLTAGTDEDGAYLYVIDGDLDVARNRAHIARCDPDTIRLLLDELSRLREAEKRYREALETILAANDEFRLGMPEEWDGDPLQDACAAARRVLQEGGE